MRMMSIKFRAILTIGILISFLMAINLFAFAEENICRKIVVFKSSVKDLNQKDTIVKKYNGIKIKELDLINAQCILVNTKTVEALKEDKNIIRVEDDIHFSIAGKPAATPMPTPPQPTQVIPWGIKKIGADQTWSNTAANLIKVAVIDSGVDLTHPDLKNNVKPGYNAINPKIAPNDDNGHGTHVAGIIAATNNAIGVVGVNPQVAIYPVKVLNGIGSGYLSDVIEALEWSIKNNMQVVNMSFSMPNSQSLHDAVIKAYNAGITQIAAAGNSNGNPVAYPAGYPEVISVSATDINDQIASFSSIGKVDFCAPGVEINSTYKGSNYSTLSGTSMAAPHVTGTVALLLSVPSKIDVDKNGVCTPNEIKKRLEATAVDLGQTGKDNIYGAGLVNAYNAIIQ